MTSDIDDLASIPLGMEEAWNCCDADAFRVALRAAPPISIAFEGTHLEGRDAIAAFHREIFATVVKGSEIAATVRFVRAVAPDVAVVHAAADVTLAGHRAPSPGRRSMQLFVVTRVHGDLAGGGDAERPPADARAPSDARRRAGMTGGRTCEDARP